MLVANRYDRYSDADIDCGRNRDRYSFNRGRVDADRFGAGRCEDRYSDSYYESEKLRTSDEDRNRLMNSLERRSSKSRLERSDEARYGAYQAITEAADNNFDRMWDRKHASEQKKEKRMISKKKMPFAIAYIVLAVVAMIGVTLSLVDFKAESVKTAKMASTGTAVSASAENQEDPNVSAAEEQQAKIGGETYVMLKNGEIAAIEIPETIQKTEEKEKGFDKFCTWLNDRFGG